MIELDFLNTMRKFKMDSLLTDIGTVIVGYSGGADSSCLLHLLNAWCEKNGVKIAAAHINHMIRGDEADRDEEFCRAEADRLGVPIYSTRVDVPELSRKWGVGTEEAARRVRYDFFNEVSKSLTGRPSGAIIATAHSSSDNLETVLMDIMRGAGLRGMCGIRPIRDGRIIRPLIADSGEDIRAWCDEREIPYVNDSTNDADDCTRNVIRHRIVPAMRTLCQSPERSAARMTNLLREDEEYISSAAREYVGGRTQIERETLANLPDAVASRVLIGLHGNAVIGDSSPTEGQIATVLRLVREKCGRSEAPLSGGVRAVIDRDVVSLTHANGDAPTAADGEFVFEYKGGCAEFENELYSLIFSDTPIAEPDEKTGEKQNIYKLSIQRSFACGKMNGSIRIRYKIDGDKYVFCGHTHKLKKLFTDAKLTEREKRLTPVLCDDDGIFWVAGFGTRDGAAAFEGERIYLLCRKK